MKKYLLFMALGLLAGCADSAINAESEVTKAPTKIIQNPKCNHLIAAKVFDIADDFVLANGCVSGTDFCPGYAVYVKKKKNEIYYEGKIIRPDTDKCLAYEGVYKYETASGFINSVPKLISVDKKIINPEYRIWEQQQIVE